MSWRSLRMVSGFALALLAFAGCGPTAPTSSVVKGTVTLDKRPLPSGTIYFYSEEGRPPEAVEVVNGEFEATLTSGEKRLEIFSYRKVTKPAIIDPLAPKTGAPPEGAKENFLPARYNTQTTLKITFPPPDGKIHLDLTSD